jgi:hypothetical protein
MERHEREAPLPPHLEAGQLTVHVSVAHMS